MYKRAALPKNQSTTRRSPGRSSNSSALHNEARHARRLLIGPFHPAQIVEGTLDSALQIPRPTSKHDGYLLPPFYTEWFEQQLGYQETHEIIDPFIHPKYYSAFEQVILFGRCIMADKTTDHRKDYGGANPDAAGGAIVMPVVLGNELVHWVGVVPHTDGFGIKTVFPAYDAETAEEKRIN